MRSFCGVFYRKGFNTGYGIIAESKLNINAKTREDKFGSKMICPKISKEIS